MAFCAECGKSNLDQATTCDGCGKPMRSAGRGGGPARFKGTMIMGGAAPKPAAPQAPTAAPAPTPAPAPQPNLAFQATMMGPMTVPGSSAPPPAAGVPPVAAVPAAPAAPRVSPKGTMIGGLNAFQIPGPPAPVASVTPVPAATPASPPAAATPAPTYDGASTGASYVEPSGAPSLDINYGEPGVYGGYGAGTKKNNTMLWIGIGVIGAIGFVVLAVAAAVWTGLISF